MKDYLISRNIVTTREKTPFDKYKVAKQTMDADLVQSVSASMKTMLGNKQAIAVRVTAG